MYIFVRFTGYVLVVFGVIAIVAGFGSAVVLVIQGATLITNLNNYLLSSGAKSVYPQDFTPYFALMAMMVFVSGLLTAAFGQLMLVFADIGSNSRETNIILRSLRNKLQN